MEGYAERTVAEEETSGIIVRLTSIIVCSVR